MLGDIPVRAGQAHPEVGVVGAATPDLRAFDDPVVSLADGRGGDTGEVRTRCRLREELDPQSVAREHGRYVTALQILRAVGENGVQTNGSGDGTGNAKIGQHVADSLFFEGQLVIRAQPPAPIGRRDGDPAIARLVELAL